MNKAINVHEPAKLGRRKVWFGAMTIVLLLLLCLQLKTDLFRFMPVEIEGAASSASKGSNGSTIRGAASSTRYATDHNNSSIHQTRIQALTSNLSKTTDNSSSHVRIRDQINADFNTTILPKWVSHHISLEEAKFHQIFPPALSSSSSSSLSTTDNAIDGTIIVKMSGELGNAMNHIICARALQLWAYQVYNMTTRIVLKPQILSGGKINTRKTLSNEHYIHQCWTQMKAWEFFEGLTPQVTQREEAQASSRWKHTVDEERLNLVNGQNETEMWQGMDHFHELSHQLAWKRSVILGENKTSSKDNNMVANDPYPPPLLTYTYFGISKAVGRYYHQIRALLEFDTGESGCCALSPDPDETVFHYRNFETELLKARKLGFEDLTAHQIAHEVFGHLTSGDKLAITTRIIKGRNNTAVDNVVGALNDRGLQVRIIGEQTPVQDFCFLMQAKKELVGSFQSTYFMLAGILGKAPDVRAYSVDSQRRRETGAVDRTRKNGFNWGADAETELTSRFHLHIYRKDENITDI